MQTLYYEVHITIEPPENEEQYNQLKVIADHFKFKIAKLVMMRGKADRKDAFMTYHAKTNDEAYVAVLNICGSLRINKFKLLRYKIEAVTLDSRIKDEMRLF